METLAGLLGYIDSQVSPAKRKLADLLRNPVDSLNQRMGLMNDRARDWNKISDLSGDALDLRMRGSVMADLPQYKQAQREQIAGLLNVVPAGTLSVAGLPNGGRELIQSKAEELANTLRSKGYEIDLQHSGSAAGASSYVRVFDPTTGRFIVDPARFSGHSKGAFNSQFVHEMTDDPASAQAFIDLAESMRARGPTELWKKQNPQKP